MPNARDCEKAGCNGFLNHICNTEVSSGYNNGIKRIVGVFQCGKCKTVQIR